MLCAAVFYFDTVSLIIESLMVQLLHKLTYTLCLDVERKYERNSNFLFSAAADLCMHLRNRHPGKVEIQKVVLHAVDFKRNICKLLKATGQRI